MKLYITAKIMGRDTRMVTIHEGADILGVTRQAVLKMINRAWIRGAKHHDLYFVPIEDIRKIKKLRGGE